jgi:hypothetical protein
MDRTEVEAVARAIDPEAFGLAGYPIAREAALRRAEAAIAALEAARAPRGEDHCGWCRGEGAIRDAEGKLGADCPRCDGRSRLPVGPAS